MKLVPISRIRKFQSLSDSALVRLYSYQGQEAWDLAKLKGYWSGTENILNEIKENEWSLAYNWIRDKMAERIPSFSGDRPIWAWTKRPSSKRKPKKYRGTDEDYRLTFLVPKSRILLSDYIQWHCALNQDFYSKTEHEFDKFNEIWQQHWTTYDSNKLEVYRKEIIKTWDNILEFKEYSDRDMIRWLGSCKYFLVQACVDRIYPHEIVEIKRMR